MNALNVVGGYGGSESVADHCAGSEETASSGGHGSPGRMVGVKVVAWGGDGARRGW